MMRLTILILLMLGGCTQREFVVGAPHIDTSPVGCGYKWFQAGYSPTRSVDCEANRDFIRELDLQLAKENAWEVARERCPSACKPRELSDTVPIENRFPDGVCRNSNLYFTTRIFFVCEN